MRILITMDPGILVPPKGYGGHERLVYLFAKEYSKLGHEVHLLVTKGSEVEGCAIHPFGKVGFPPQKWDARISVLYSWIFLWKHRKDFDLVHNFGRLAYLIPILNCSIKKLMTYGREISSRNIQFVNRLPNQNLIFTGCSNDLISRLNKSGVWKTVYNAIDFSKYELRKGIEDNAPLIFLGRIEKVKGCHIAIQVALRSNHQLIIAGNISTLSDEILYFENKIKPFIDGKQIIYVGEVNDQQKSEWLGKSKALLMPIEWNEPFGIVMIEAMACGTPVLAFNRGSVNEVVTEGVTGFKVANELEMIESIKKIETLNREYCRKHASDLFDVGVIASQYLSFLH